MAQHPGARAGQIRLMQRGAALQMGDQQGHLQYLQLLQRQPFVQLQPEMCPHAGTQHLGRPQCSRAFQRQHLLEPQCARAAQNRADIAGVLDAIQYHTVHIRLKPGLHLGRPLQQKTHAGRRLQRAHLGKQRIIQHRHPLGASVPGPGNLPPGTGSNHGPCRPHSPLQCSTTQMVALHPDLPLLAIGSRVLRQFAELLDQRVVTRGDVDDFHRLTSIPTAPCRSTMATGAKLRR